MPDFFEHPLIKKGKIQARAYQEAILKEAMKNNLLAVLPTGLGKTPIAVMLAARRLEQFPEGKIIVMAPTRPLTNQHFKTFRDFLNMPEEKMQVLTGNVKPSKREALYREKQIIFATPQTIQRDIESGRLSLRDVVLLVTDEAHHSIGRYSYPFVAKKYLEKSEHPRILGLTASPGGTREKIMEICSNLGIESVEIRTEKDHDVSPYVKEKKIEWFYVELPESFLRVSRLLSEAYSKKIEGLRKWRMVGRRRISKRELLHLQKTLISKIKQGNRKAFIPISLVTQAIKIEHALGLLETQGVGILEKYWNKLRSEKSNSTKRMLANKNISQAMNLTRGLLESGSRHPKIGKLCSIVEQQLRKKPESKIIIFANYRSTVKEIVDVLGRIKRAKPVEFIGQRSGITQKEQMKRLGDFRSGAYNVLVGTSISEEGLDIPEMDMAIFYEPVPSEIRSIQRRGRVGRQKFGRIIILITRGTRDEAYFWTARAKEKRMKKTLYDMKHDKKPLKKTGQYTLGDF